MGADQGENVTCGCVDSCSFVNQPSIPSCFTLDPVRDRSLFCKESGTLCFLFLEFFLKRCFTFKNGSTIMQTIEVYHASLRGTSVVMP